MIYRILALVFVLLVSACGGGEGDIGGVAPSTAQPGIYAGTITPDGKSAETAAGIITSDGKVALVDITTSEVFIGTISGNSLTGKLYATSGVDSTAEVTTVSGNTISGTYTSSLGGGVFALVADPDLYSRTSSLTKLAGTWVDNTFTNVVGVSTWVIQADGMFDVTTETGCAGSGAFSVINPAKNGYNLSLNITNCSVLNGDYSGFAVTSDNPYTDNTIALIFSNGVFGAPYMPVKP